MNNPDKCLEYARQAYELSIETAYSMGQARALIMMGIVNKRNSDYNLAFQYAEKADSIAFENDFAEVKISAIELKGKLYRYSLCSWISYRLLCKVYCTGCTGAGI